MYHVFLTHLCTGGGTIFGWGVKPSSNLRRKKEKKRKKRINFQSKICVNLKKCTISLKFDAVRFFENIANHMVLPESYIKLEDFILGGEQNGIGATEEAKNIRDTKTCVKTNEFKIQDLRNS